MKMNKYFILLFSILLSGLPLKAQSEDDLPELVIIEFDEDENEGQTLQNDWFQYPQYSPWEKVSLEGKLRMKGLPVSPSVKIYMEKGNLIDLSFRAPLVGEAMRIEITPDSVSAVNKLNKTYIKEANPLNLQENKTGSRGICEIQDLLLGRFFLPGIDINNVNLDYYIDVFSNNSGQFNVIPKGKAELEGISYGFVVDNYFNPLMLVVLARNAEVDAVYNYSQSGYNIEFTYNDGRHLMTPVLELKNPQWNIGKSDRLRIDKKYRKVDITQFINNFGG